MYAIQFSTSTIVCMYVSFDKIEQRVWIIATRSACNEVCLIACLRLFPILTY